MAFSGDIKIAWDNVLFGGGDFEIENSDLAADNGLETAAIISLFSDRRARDDDLLLDVDNIDKRGWWGDDVLPIVEGDKIGSRLWLLLREKTTPETLTRAKEYIREALQWMIDDEIAKSLDIEVERQASEGNDRLAFRVSILKQDDTKIAFEYDTIWENTFAV
jgi:phage gp46-like protein